MTLKQISAEIISRPGDLGDPAYPAIAIQLKGFESPYVLTLAFPAVVYRALSERVDPLAVYDAIASAVNRMQHPGRGAKSANPDGGRRRSSLRGVRPSGRQRESAGGVE